MAKGAYSAKYTAQSVAAAASVCSTGPLTVSMRIDRQMPMPSKVGQLGCATQQSSTNATISPLVCETPARRKAETS